MFTNIILVVQVNSNRMLQGSLGSQTTHSIRLNKGDVM